MRVIAMASTFALVALTACGNRPQQQQYEETYADRVMQIPMPTSDSDRQAKCARLRSAIAQQQSIAATAPSTFQGPRLFLVQNQVRGNIAALESRASDFGCSAAFSSRSTEAAAPAPEKPKIDQCIASCKANTSRTAEQCFDACNR